MLPHEVFDGSTWNNSREKEVSVDVEGSDVKALDGAVHIGIGLRSGGNSFGKSSNACLSDSSIISSSFDGSTVPEDSSSMVSEKASLPFGRQSSESHGSFGKEAKPGPIVS